MGLTPLQLKALPVGTLVRTTRYIGISEGDGGIPKGKTYVVGYDISFQEWALTMTFEVVRYPEGYNESI